MNGEIILYIRPGCLWCRQAVAYCESNGIECDLRDITRSAADLYRVMKVSQHMLTPTLECGERILEGFTIAELKAFLEELPPSYLSAEASVA